MNLLTDLLIYPSTGLRTMVVPFASVRATTPATARPSPGRDCQGHQNDNNMCQARSGYRNRFINARTVDVFAHEVVIAIVFGNNVVAVMEVRGSVAINGLFDAPAGWVIFVGDGVPICRIVART